MKISAETKRMSTVFPSFSIESGKPILWKGKPLRGAGLKDVLFAAKIARHYTQVDTIVTARARWNQASLLLNAVLEKLPTMDDLELAIPVVPPAPTPPLAFSLEEPQPESHPPIPPRYSKVLDEWNVRNRSSYLLGLEVYHEKSHNRDLSG